MLQFPLCWVFDVIQDELLIEKEESNSHPRIRRTIEEFPTKSPKALLLHAWTETQNMFQKNTIKLPYLTTNATFLERCNQRFIIGRACNPLCFAMYNPHTVLSCHLSSTRSVQDSIELTILPAPRFFFDNTHHTSCFGTEYSATKPVSNNFLMNTFRNLIFGIHGAQLIPLNLNK